MKKLVLTLVLGVFAFGASGFNTIDPTDDCAEEAWQYGTDEANKYGGKANPYYAILAYVATNQYYEENCL